MGEKNTEVSHSENQSLPGENIMCHQRLVVMLLKIGKGKVKYVNH